MEYTLDYPEDFSCQFGLEITQHRLARLCDGGVVPCPHAGESRPQGGRAEPPDAPVGGQARLPAVRDVFATRPP